MKRFILLRNHGYGSVRIFRHKMRSFSSTQFHKLLTNPAIHFSKQMILNLNYNANLARCFHCSAKLNIDGNDVNAEILSPDVEAFNKLLCCEREIVHRKFDRARKKASEEEGYMKLRIVRINGHRLSLSLHRVFSLQIHRIIVFVIL